MRSVPRSVLLVAGLMIGPMISGVDARQVAAQPPAERIHSGTVVSASAGSLILRTDEGEYTVFVLDRDTLRPRTIPRGAQVRIVERGDVEPTDGFPTALSIEMTSDAAATPPAAQSNVPPAMRRAERRLRRQASLYRIGGYGAVAIDPELVTFGARGSLGPIFDSNFSFRPGVELGFGELTTLLGVNLDGVYHTSRRDRRRRWIPYFGAGIALAFRHENLVREQDGDRFDFGDYDLDSGVNFIAGIEHSSGVFLQLVSTAYSSPHVRFLIGTNFW